MPSSLFDLRGKVAIVTGSSRGIGFASARGMSEHGAKVVICSRKAEACDAAASEVRLAGGEAISVPCNIGRKDESQRVVDAAHDAWGRVDIVMANAAIHPWVGSVLDLKEETFAKFMQVNVQSSIWLAQMTLPGMLERRYGRIIRGRLDRRPARRLNDWHVWPDQGRGHAVRAQPRLRIREPWRDGKFALRPANVQDGDGTLTMGRRSAARWYQGRNPVAPLR